MTHSWKSVAPLSSPYFGNQSVTFTSPKTYITPSKTLNHFDYGRGRSISPALIDSTFKQNLAMYTALCLSRSVASFFRGQEIHTQRETVEHISRDLPSIFMAYFGAYILNRSLAVVLFRDAKEKLLKLSKDNLTHKQGWFNRLKDNFKYIFKGTMISAEEIDSFKGDAISRIKKAHAHLSPDTLKTELKPVLKYFEKLRFQRNAINFAGTAINLLLMGFLIPYANIRITQAYAQGYHARQANKHINDRSS